MHEKFIKSPLNYIGGKYKILPQILPLFPKDINRFVDLFAGGANVSLNVEANKVIINDNLTYIVDLYKKLQKTSEKNILKHINKRIEMYSLSLTNQVGYLELRAEYNKTKDPLDLFVLIAYSFNHQIRFNSSHEFNNPFGKNRSCYNSSIEYNLKSFIKKLQNIDVEFYSTDFDKFDISFLNANDFVYCDPPYLITTGTYNDGKRGFTGWGEKEELALLRKLDKLNSMGVSFALSNVIQHKGRVNSLLKKWLDNNPEYLINSIDINYSNSNYHAKNKDKMTTEVLITNYIPAKIAEYKQLPLFPMEENYTVAYGQ